MFNTTAKVKKTILISFSIIACTIFISAFSYMNVDSPTSHAEQPIDNETEILDTKSNTIQLALLLDTSSSMDGLIEQAKSQLWNILNAMTDIEKEDDDDLTLEIALYEYGNDGIRTPEYISQLSAFTSDVDEISDKLFSLTTNGGDEFCGAVIKNSIETLDWTNNGQLKMIYIAGNESFNQGHTDYKEMCKSAKQNDIFINTIFCGPKIDGKNLEWDTAAKIANGEYSNINQNLKTEYIDTPYDDEIAALNQRLNATYIPYGHQGNEKKRKLELQDSNANKYGTANAANRTKFKSSKKFKAESWDLVDAYKKDKNVLQQKELLNAEQNAMTIEELERQIEQASQSRDDIKDELKQLEKQRRAYQEKHRKQTNTNSLESQFIEIIKKQAEAKGYQLKA